MRQQAYKPSYETYQYRPTYRNMEIIFHENEVQINHLLPLSYVSTIARIRWSNAKEGVDCASMNADHDYLVCDTNCEIVRYISSAEET